MTDLIVNPRESSASFLARIDHSALLRESGHPRSQHVKGEMHVVASEALIDRAVSIRLQRLGLFSVDSPPGAFSAGLSIIATEGEGELRQAGSSGESWQLEMESSGASVSYERLDSPPEPVTDRDYSFATDLRFSLRISLRANLIESRDLTIDSGTISLGHESDALQSIQLALEGLSVNVFPASATPRLLIPLRPVLFPLSTSQWTGGTWTRQLRAANEVWGKCCIKFVERGVERVNRPNLARSSSVDDILASYKEEGVIEVFFVQSGIAGYTSRKGHQNARVIIPEPNSTNPYLLAHELGHVMGGCHPRDTKCDCTCPRWLGSPNSVLKVGHPNISINPEGNCIMARKQQPLIETTVFDCRLSPDL